MCDDNCPDIPVTNRFSNFLFEKKNNTGEILKNNEFLIDFIRKRQNGMNSIHHEVVFYDKNLIYYTNTYDTEEEALEFISTLNMTGIIE